MRYLSVCSGIEAASVAWEPMGWEAAAFSEIEKFPRDLLKHHYSNIPLHGDFTTIREDEYGTIDLLVGGTPCQDFSIAGLRKGLSGERGNLTLEFIRLAKRTRAKWVVWENVPGVLSIDKGRAFGAFLGGLAECGYGFAYRILDAQYFGVPQRRRRVFVIGYLGDWRVAAQVLSERESLCGDIAPFRNSREEVAGTFTSRAKSGGWGTDVDLASSGYMRPVEIAKCLTSRGAGAGNLDVETANVIPINTQLGLRGESSNSKREGIGIGREGDPAFTIQASHGHAVAIAGNIIDRKTENGGNGFGYDASGACYTLTKADRHAVACLTSNGDAHSGFRDAQGLVPVAFDTAQITSKTNRSIPQSTCHTLHQKNTHHAILPNMQVRRLTPVECERLQGFPDNYTKISKKTADGSRYKALGNSMAVPVMRWIGEQISRVA